MAAFCMKCGFPQSGSNAFCSKCGASVSATAAPMAPPGSGSGLLKLVVVVVVFLGLAGVAAVAGLYYVGHRVKQAVVQKAAENGVDLSSITSPTSSAPHARKVKVRPMCEYLSRDEAAKVLGEPVERAVVMDSMCVYYGPAGLSANLAREQTTQTMKRMEKGGGVSVTELESFEQVARDLGLAGGSQPAGESEAPLLMVAVHPDGRAQMTALMASNAIFGGIYKAASEGGATFSREIPNLGDKAVRMPKLGLNVLQGDTSISVIPGPVPNGDEKAIEIARMLLGRI